eukprot:scaffold109716_cov17-Tisochrysis_lutea.AAC.1
MTAAVKPYNGMLRTNSTTSCCASGREIAPAGLFLSKQDELEIQIAKRMERGNTETLNPSKHDSELATCQADWCLSKDVQREYLFLFCCYPHHKKVGPCAAKVTYCRESSRYEQMYWVVTVNS